MRKKCSVCLWVLALLLSCLSGKSAYAATSTTIAKHILNSIFAITYFSNTVKDI